MSRHRALLPTLLTIFIALLCPVVFAQQAVSPQKQAASSSQFTVNVSNGTIFSSPTLATKTSLPPDILKGLGTSGLALLTEIAKRHDFGIAELLGNSAGKLLFSGDLWGAKLNNDAAQTWDSVRDYGLGLVPGVGASYSILEPLVEARLRWQLRQQGMADEQIDQAVLETKQLGEERALELISDQTSFGLTLSTDPFDVLNSATKQGASSVTGGSLLLVDPIDTFIASERANQSLEATINNEVLPGTEGSENDATPGISGAQNLNGDYNQVNPQGTVGQPGSDELNADAEVQISSELVDNQPPSEMSPSGTSIVDSGPLIRPQASASPSSGGFRNWQTWVQIGLAALQAYQVYEAAQSHTSAAPRSGRKQQVQSLATQHRSCSNPEECAARQLAWQTCSIRNDCSSFGGPPPTNPGQGCSIQCGLVGNTFMCWGNAFTAACPTVH